MPLSRQQARDHTAAMKLVDADRPLTPDEKEFVLDHYQPSASTTQVLDGAFFTPRGLARELATFDIGLDRPHERIIDLAAGIGRLAYETLNDPDRAWRTMPLGELVCVERNPQYVRVGRRILPEATWICGDLLDVPDMNVGFFDCAISNPPFGNIPRSRDALAYRPRQFEYHAIATAARIARRGVFIIPRASSHEEDMVTRTADCLRFTTHTGIHLSRSCVDPDPWADKWGSISPRVALVTADFPTSALF